MAQWSIYETQLRAWALERFHVINGIPNLTTRRCIHRACLSIAYDCYTLTELRLLRNDEEMEIDGLIPLMHFRKRNGHPISESALHQRVPLPSQSRRRAIDVLKYYLNGNQYPILWRCIENYIIGKRRRRESTRRAVVGSRYPILKKIS